MYNNVDDYTCIPTFRIWWVRRTLDGYFIADLSKEMTTNQTKFEWLYQHEKPTQCHEIKLTAGN